LTLGNTHPAQPQNLPSVPVLKPQEVVHDSSSLCEAGDFADVMNGSPDSLGRTPGGPPMWVD
jgi:hypothetical protein